MKNKHFYSVQDWLPFKKILDKGIIQLKDYSYIKILKISPINFNLKSEMEKESILNSYKIFLKTCNFNLQILIQSNKKDLSKHISKIEEINKNKQTEEVAQKYIKYIQEMNEEKKTNTKYFYIIIKEKLDIEKTENEKIVLQKLKENYYKLKETLSRCGNKVEEIQTKRETVNIIYCFLNYRKQNKLEN